MDAMKYMAGMIGIVNGIIYMTIANKGEKDMSLKLITCDVCCLPYPKESITKRNKSNMCANCYVMTKRMYKPW